MVSSDSGGGSRGRNPGGNPRPRMKRPEARHSWFCSNTEDKNLRTLCLHSVFYKRQWVNIICYWILTRRWMDCYINTDLWVHLWTSSSASGSEAACAWAAPGGGHWSVMCTSSKYCWWKGENWQKAIKIDHNVLRMKIFNCKLHSLWYTWI